MRQIKRAWAEISLDALCANFNQIRKTVGESCKIMAVVKADAYGHGFLEVSKAFLECGADYLGVAFLDEALQLRLNGIDAPVLILGNAPLQHTAEIVENGITATVSSYSQAQVFSEIAKDVGKKAKIHIKIDTGMTRIGFSYRTNEEANAEAIRDIEEITKLENIEVEGIFTHFACADDKDESITVRQFEFFTGLLCALEKKNIQIPIKHVCNSAAMLRFPHMHLDMVRPGISLYGCYPSVDFNWRDVRLTPAMQFKAEVVSVKMVEGGTPVSYGGKYITGKGITRIATISAGYADGLSRTLSSKAKVIAKDTIVPVVGTICMDQCMIDATSVNNVSVGDEIVIFGKTENNAVPVEQLAIGMGTISYEVLCVVGKRVPRIYTKSGKVVSVLNYLLQNSCN